MVQRWLAGLLGLLVGLGAIAAPVYAAGKQALAEAIFAGGCFWCMEQPFDALPGVTDTTSGYAGGHVANPSYYQVSAGGTGHVEAVRVTYDPSQVSYATLLDVFWHNIDPMDANGQFCDKGGQYQSKIFVQDEAERQAAEASKQALATTPPFDQSEQVIATTIEAVSTFYPAEDYHQNYYQTHPVRYRVYRFGCGRDQRLSQIWGDVSH